MNNKRYILFGGNVYYAGGGMNDYINSYTTLELAKEKGDAEYGDRIQSWYHIYDVVEEKIVYKNGEPQT